MSSHTGIFFKNSDFPVFFTHYIRYLCKVYNYSVFWDVKFYIPLKYEIIPKNLKWITYYSPKLLQNQSLRWLLTSHRSNATICRQKSWFYCTFDLHDGNHFWYLGNRRLHFWAICNITSTTVAYGYWAILTFSNDHIYDKINDKIIQKNQSKMIITSSLIFQT